MNPNNPNPTTYVDFADECSHFATGAMPGVSQDQSFPSMPYVPSQQRTQQHLKETALLQNPTTPEAIKKQEDGNNKPSS